MQSKPFPKDIFYYWDHRARKHNNAGMFFRKGGTGGEQLKLRRFSNLLWGQNVCWGCSLEKYCSSAFGAAFRPGTLESAEKQHWLEKNVPAYMCLCMNNRTTGWFGLERTSESTSFHPPDGVRDTFTILGCSDLHPSLPSTSPGFSGIHNFLGHPVPGSPHSLCAFMQVKIKPNHSPSRKKWSCLTCETCLCSFKA